MTAHEDFRLIQALLDNDSKGINEIYERYADRIERFVCSNSGTPDDARDVFQDALVAITRRARKTDFVLTCPMEAYLYLVCRGKWFNELKRRKRAQVTIDETEGFTETSEADALAGSTLMDDARSQLFQQFFKKLSEGCRTIIQLSWTGISMEELSQQLGISYSYARKHKSECIAKLTNWIQASPEFAALK